MYKSLFISLLFLWSCKSYTSFVFHGNGVTILSTHKPSPQPYCQQLHGMYCIISPCCTGVYWDTTGLAVMEIDYKNQHAKK